MAQFLPHISLALPSCVQHKCQFVTIPPAGFDLSTRAVPETNANSAQELNANYSRRDTWGYAAVYRGTHFAGLPIHFAAMTYFYDFDRSFIVVHRVKNAVIALADAVSVISKKPFAAGRSRIGRKTADLPHNSAEVSLRNARKFFLGAALDPQTI